MRPRHQVQSVILYTQRTVEGLYIPRKVELHSWVALEPARTAEHAKKSKKNGLLSIVDVEKAQILEFRVKQGSTTISAIKVQHAYMQEELCLDPGAPALQAACNYLYPSTSIDWVDPLRVMEPICVSHAEVGEASKGDRSHRELMEDSIFFYNAKYFPPTSATFGHVEDIFLPDFDDVAWSLPDMSTSEAFRVKLRHNFLLFMNPKTGSRVTHISWFMPIGVMVDLFACAPRIHKTRTLFVSKDMSDELFGSLMDHGWQEKVVIAEDVVKCVVDPLSVHFKYHLGRSTLYATFQFNRLRLLQDGQWEAIDQCETIEIVKVHCVCRDVTQELEVGSNWTLNCIREEIVIAFVDAAPSNFTLYIENSGQIQKKLTRRTEEKTFARDVLPPMRLLIIADVDTMHVES